MEESDRGDGGGRKKYDRKLKSAFRTTWHANLIAFYGVE